MTAREFIGEFLMRDPFDGVVCLACGADSNLVLVESTNDLGGATRTAICFDCYIGDPSDVSVIAHQKNS